MTEEELLVLREARKAYRDGKLNHYSLDALCRAVGEWLQSEGQDQPIFATPQAVTAAPAIPSVQ